MRLHDNIDYFAKIREGQMREQSQIKIAARWRGYSVRKKFAKPKKKQEDPKVFKEKQYKSRVGPYMTGKKQTVGKHTYLQQVKGSAGKKVSQESGKRPRQSTTNLKVSASGHVKSSASSSR